jgi:uroporphyrin-III C-methyltransferase
LLAGLGADTPVAVVQHASLPQQRQACCTLGALSATIAAEGLGSPAIIVVGDVVRGVMSLAQQHAPHARVA